MRHGTEGFTLLEVLVSLTIIGLLFSALAGGLRFGMSADRAVVRLTANNEDLVVLDQSLRRLISHASPGGALFDTPFYGEAHHFSFTALPSGALGREVGGAADVAVGVDRRHRLTLVWRSRYASPLPGSRPMVEVLVESVDHVDVDYEGPRSTGPSGFATGWRRDWSEAGLPDLVRLRVVMSDARKGALPDIVLETKLRERGP